jgi:hypothetical protein
VTAPAITIPDTVPPEWATPADDNGGDGSEEHYFCCDREVALCGEPLDAEPAAGVTDAELCRICERIDQLEVPCGVRFCRLRRFGRSLRDRRKS